MGYEWAQEKKNRSTRETAVRYTTRPLSSPYPSVPQGSQDLAFVSIWSPELCLYSLDPTLLWILWTTFGLDTLFLKGFFIFILFYFIFARCLFFINIGKESSLSHTLGKGISSILRGKKNPKNKNYPINILRAPKSRSQLTSVISGSSNLIDLNWRWSRRLWTAFNLHACGHPQCISIGTFGYMFLRVKLHLMGFTVCL